MSSAFKRQPLTTIQIERALLDSHGAVTLAADELGVTRTSLAERVKKHARLQRVLIEARENRVDRAEAVVDKLLEANHFGAAKFTLRTQGRHRGWAESAPGTVNLSFSIERIDEPRDEQGNVLELPGEVE